MPGEDDDFSVRDMTQIISAMTSTTSLMTALLGAVAAVSLLVGGIGVMNIMLVSVTERTREIGIRLAIGALEGQVLMQFLVEAFVLALLGGVIGIALGLGLAGLAAYGMQIPFAPSPYIIASVIRLFRRHRRGVRIFPGAPRRPPRSHRGIAARIAGQRA